MIMDEFLVMSDAQAVTASIASTDYIDTLAEGDAITPGARLHVLVNTLFETSDVGTLTIALQTDAATTFDTGPTTLFTTSALGAASLTAGSVLIDIVVPKGVLRYLRVYYTVANTFTAGNIDARIVLDTAKTMDKNL